MEKTTTMATVLADWQDRLPSSLRSSAPATAVSDRERLALLRLYNPAMQIVYTQRPGLCSMGTAPTLAAVCRDYGMQTALDWLRIELSDYQKFAAVKDEAVTEKAVIDDMAALIMADFYYLKLPELMLFFRRMKTGRYGELYGRINPQNFFAALRCFLKERADIIDKAGADKRARERAEAASNAVSREEYDRMKQQSKFEQHESNR